MLFDDRKAEGRATVYCTWIGCKKEGHRGQWTIVTHYEEYRDAVGGLDLDWPQDSRVAIQVPD